MKKTSRILSAIGMGALAIVASCGGSGSENTYELPVPLARVVTVTIPAGTGDWAAGGDEADTTYIFGFEIKSKTDADIYVGSSPGVPASQLMVVGYIPEKDTAETVAFYWESVDEEGEGAGMESQVIMRNCVNLTKGQGTCTCDVLDKEDTRVDPMQMNLSATISHFTPHAGQ